MKEQKYCWSFEWNELLSTIGVMLFPSNVGQLDDKTSVLRSIDWERNGIAYPLAKIHGFMSGEP